MSDWHAVSSAPAGERPVLLSSSSGIVLGHWSLAAKAWLSGGRAVHHVTHWAPVPPAPRTFTPRQLARQLVMDSLS